MPRDHDRDHRRSPSTPGRSRPEPVPTRRRWPSGRCGRRASDGSSRRPCSTGVRSEPAPALSGPAIVELANTTIVVLDGFELLVDGYGSFVLYTGERGRRADRRARSRSRRPAVTLACGIVGAGAIGRGFVVSLVRARFPTAVFDLDPAAAALAVEAGAEPAGSLAGARRASPTCVLLARARHAADRRGDRRRARGGAPQRDRWSWSRAPCHRRRRSSSSGASRASGVGVLDAPVSGGPVKAAAGELAIMAGGPDEVFAAVPSGARGARLAPRPRRAHSGTGRSRSSSTTSWGR